MATPNLLSNEVQELVDNRSKTYGEPLNHYTRLAAIWTALLEQHYGFSLSHPMPPRLVALFMVGMKMLRASNVPHPDSHVDLAAFNQFAAEFTTKEMNCGNGKNVATAFADVISDSERLNNTPR